ncbi:MAG: hypothetical protein DMD40_04240 [Gemmatimonadetes bacterium]|nr:MAG: hypothetical protein DMD40_04240 [Gemmatimonadota bacterium]
MPDGSQSPSFGGRWTRSERQAGSSRAWPRPGKPRWKRRRSKARRPLLKNRLRKRSPPSNFRDGNLPTRRRPHL